MVFFCLTQINKIFALENFSGDCLRLIKFKFSLWLSELVKWFNLVPLEPNICSARNIDYQQGKKYQVLQ